MNVKESLGSYVEVQLSSVALRITSLNHAEDPRPSERAKANARVPTDRLGAMARQVRSV